MAAGGGWVIGTAAQMQQAGLWTQAAYLACMVAAAVLLAGAITRRTPSAVRWPRLVALVLAASLAAFALAGLRAGWRLADALDTRWEGRDLLVSGEVVSLPQDREQGLSFVFRIDAARAPGDADDADVHGRLPQRVLLSWYAGGDAGLAAWTGARPQVRAGQRWRLPVRLRRPHGLLNRNAFDVELWWFEQGIRGLGTVRPSGALLLGEGGGMPVDRLRQRLRDAVHLRVPDARSAGVIAALALGDQAAIERADWDVFRQTGVAHLVSISGMHVTLFAWLAGGCIAWLWRGSERLLLWQPAPVAARVGGVLAALGYALFAGWGLPAQRTVWMLAIAALPLLLGRRWPWPLVWLAGGVVVLAIDPWALLSASFWLSFGAVGLLLSSALEDGRAAAHEGRAALLRRQLREGLRTQAVATLGLAPLALVFFGQISVVGFVANLVAIPLVSFVVTPLALLGGAWAPLWDAAAWLVRMLVAWLQWLGSADWAVWHASAAPWWAQAAALLAAAVGMSRLPLRVRLLAWPLVLPLLWPPVPRPEAGSFDLVAADVGQGAAVLVRTATHLLVYDSGPVFGPARGPQAGPRAAAGTSGDAGERVLLPLLRSRGETRIDRLVLSHGDADHVGGAASLMRGMPVDELLSSLPATHALQPMAARHARCDAGQRWSWDGVDFELLHPRAADYAPRGTRLPSTNSLSCVLRIAAAGRVVLLAGDIGVHEEAALLARGTAPLRCDVLLAPHHGSGGSSSQAFIDAVRPAVVVFQAGYLNRYGHPAPEVVARWRAAGAATLDSAACGAWQWRIGAGSLAGVGQACERERTRRYWRHPDAVHSGSPDSGG